MEQAEYLTKYPWQSPTKEIDPRKAPVPVDGVQVVAERKHVLVSIGATHKSIDFMEPIHSNAIDRIDDKSWELFSVSHEGVAITGVGGLGTALGWVIPSATIATLLYLGNNMWYLTGPSIEMD